MNEEQLVDEFDRQRQLILEADTDNFFELAKIINRNPKTDFAGADLHKVDLSECDLEGANLKNTDLRFAKLLETDLRNADLSYANLCGADLRGSKLLNTNFSNANVKNARFQNNLGMDEGTKLELLERGAIFESSHPEIVDEPSPIIVDLTTKTT